MDSKEKEKLEHAEEEGKAWIRGHRRETEGIAAAVLALLLVLSGVYFYRFDRPAARGTVTLEVPRASTGRDIAEMLEEKGVISSAFRFRAFGRLLGGGDALQSGSYTLRQGLTVAEAMKELHSGKADTATITVPEGSTVAQIADILSQAGVAGAENFLDTATDYGPLPYQYGPVAADVKAEGWLFPDTYDIPKAYDAKEICDVMYHHMDTMLSADIRRRAAAKHMSLHDLVTLASMVEREAKFKEDQVPIASVMLKRLQVGMPLQIDATVQYARGEQKENLTVADTRIDSPYNTYLHPGLPPGPIGSPGLEAIEAVLTAQPGEYLYYVAKPDGHHVFTRTYEEHQAETAGIYGESS